MRANGDGTSDAKSPNEALAQLPQLGHIRSRKSLYIPKTIGKVFTTCRSFLIAAAASTQASGAVSVDDRHPPWRFRQRTAYSQASSSAANHVYIHIDHISEFSILQTQMTIDSVSPCAARTYIPSWCQAPGEDVSRCIATTYAAACHLRC